MRALMPLVKCSTLMRSEVKSGKCACPHEVFRHMDTEELVHLSYVHLAVLRNQANHSHVINELNHQIGLVNVHLRQVEEGAQDRALRNPRVEDQRDKSSIFPTDFRSIM